MVIVSGGIWSGRCVAGPEGWWSDLVGYGLAADLHCYNVVGFDFAPLAPTEPPVSTADQARLIAAVLPQLGASRISAWIGTSYGGMVGLAFPGLFPARLDRLCVNPLSRRLNAAAPAKNREVSSMSFVYGNNSLSGHGRWPS